MAELHSFICFQTGNHYPGDIFEGDWINTWGTPFYIKRAQYFMGAYIGMQLDFDADLTLVRKNGSVDYIMRVEWDHYADPNCAQANNPYIDFGDNQMTVQPEETIHLHVQTNGPVDPNKWWGMQVQIYYTLPSGL